MARSPAEDPPSLQVHRDDGRDTAVVFVHGFSGDLETTWGDFPRYLLAEPRVDGWDLLSVGYTTNLRLDVPGLWSAAPDLARLGRLLATVAAEDQRLKARRGVAFVAHSMGGLVVQRALLDSPELARRADQVILFGTPSGGTIKAKLASFFKRQLRDMGQGSRFITDLRRSWKETFGGGAPFRFLAVAGDRDEFVPATSSLEPFPEHQRAVVYGDHLEIVKPRSADSLSVATVVNALAGEGAPAGPWNGARIAVERREFQQAVDALLPHSGELDDRHAVTLALALESLGRSEEAIEMLEGHTAEGTDVLGVLAGRLKRRWQTEGRRSDGERAEELYGRGLAQSEASGVHAQAFYHAINLAYLALARRDDDTAAREYAERALGHCEKAPEDAWNLATQGEAALVLGDVERGLERYRAALDESPDPRQIASMHAQAMRIAELRGGRKLAEKLETLFRGPAPS